MNILFLGTLISEKTRDHFVEKGLSPEPADIAQNNILMSLAGKETLNVSAICSPRIKGFPKSNIFKVKNERFLLHGIPVTTVGYLNIGDSNFFFRNRNFISFCKKWCKKNKSSTTIIVYSLNSTFLKAAISIKQRNPGSKICLIVPDLPSYMYKYKGLVGLLRQRDLKAIEKMRQSVDCYGLYTQQMAEALGISSDKFVVTEGFPNDRKIITRKSKLVHRRKVCLYSGSLEPVYGIQTLIDAFDGIHVDAELHIYGDPEMAKQYTYNKNVLYQGILSPDKMFAKMAESDLLINPRPSSLELSKYSFPSKTFEYLASARPCIMCKLPGVPEEYFEHIFVFDSETTEGFRSKIEEVLSLGDDYLSSKGFEAATFLLEKKSSLCQVHKLLDLVQQSDGAN